MKKSRPRYPQAFKDEALTLGDRVGIRGAFDTGSGIRLLR